MTNAELIACIQAEEQGKVVECRMRNTTAAWKPHTPEWWDNRLFEYRIRPEPRKCWVKWMDDGMPCVVAHSGSPTENVRGWQLVVEEAK